jgi:hypothetical protein
MTLRHDLSPVGRHARTVPTAPSAIFRVGRPRYEEDAIAIDSVDQTLVTNGPATGAGRHTTSS